MISTGCLRLLFLCVWLLVGDVNSENTKRGYVLRVQAGQALAGVHDDKRNHKNWSEHPSADQAPGGNIYPSHENQMTDSTSPKSQSHHYYPAAYETLKIHVQNYNQGRKMASTLPVRKVQAHDNYIQAVLPQIYNAKTQLSKGYSVPAVKIQSDYNPPNKKYAFSNKDSPTIQAIQAHLESKYHNSNVNPSRSNIRSLNPRISYLAPRTEPRGYHPAYVWQRSFGTNIDRKRDSTVERDFSRGNSRNAGPPLSYLSLPRPRGYAHTRRLKPGTDRTRPQVQVPVQGKFKPFQILPIQDDVLVPSNSSESETATNQTIAETTLPPSLNSTDFTYAVLPSTTEESSTKSASPSQTEGKDAETELKHQSESSVVDGPALEEEKANTLS